MTNEASMPKREKECHTNFKQRKTVNFPAFDIQNRPSMNNNTSSLIIQLWSDLFSTLHCLQSQSHENGNLRSIVVAFVEKSVAIQCPPLGPFRIERIQLLTVFSTDRPFVQQVGPSVYGCGPGARPTSLTFPLCLALSRRWRCVANQLKPQVPKSAREQIAGLMAERLTAMEHTL